MARATPVMPADVGRELDRLGLLVQAKDQEIEKLRAGLAFYADDANWLPGEDKAYPVVLMDLGHKARRTFQAVER